MSKRRVYRLSFVQQGKVYEVYARKVSQAGFYGFVEVEGLLFGEKSTLVVDPVEEKLKAEFKDVARFHVPMHEVLRIDEVSAPGTAKVVEGEVGGKVTPFPVYGGGPGSGSGGGRD